MTSNLKTIRDFIRYAATRLNAAGVPFGHGFEDAVQEASWLVIRSVQLPFEKLDTFLDCRLTEPERALLLQRIERRAVDRVPTPYILGEARLTGYDFRVNRSTLIPRSFIAELLADSLAPWVEEPESVGSVLDLCAGSGCLGIIAADKFPNAFVDLADISPEALEVARENVADYGLQDRVEVLEGDLFRAVGDRGYDVILTNPPYVTQAAVDAFPPEYRSEPQIALGAGQDGLDVVNRILAGARAHLNAGGILVCEVGDDRPQLEEAWPELPFEWPETSAGDGMVFVLGRDDLPSGGE